MNLKLNNKILNSTNDKTEELRFFIFLAFTACLPFNYAYSTVLVTCFLLATIIGITKAKLKAIPKNIWLFQMVYFIGVIGLFQSLHIDKGIELLGRQISILLFPIFIPLAFSITKERVQLTLNCISFATLFCILILFIRTYILIINLELPFSQINPQVYLHHNFSRSIPIHSVYLSLYVLLSLFNLIHLGRVSQHKALRAFCFSSCFFLFIGLLFLSSRIALATFFIVIISGIIFRYKKKKLLALVIFGVAFILCLIIFRNSTYLYNTFYKNSVSEMSTKNIDEFVLLNSAEPRAARWSCLVKLVLESPLIGYGTGDEKAILKTEYIKSNLCVSYFKSFDAHNQYLSFLLKHGIVGLIIFIYAFITYYKMALRNRNFIYIAFLTTLTLSFLTENILDSEKGIYFFSLFNTLFGLQTHADNSNKGTMH